MLIRDYLNPIDGIFSNMPQEIWQGDLDPSSLDIELWTRIGGLEAAPLFKFFIANDTLDVAGLAKLLYSRYHNNWQKMWNALLADYDVLLTSSNNESRTVERISDNTETRDLVDAEDVSSTEQQTGTNSNTRTGSVSRDENQRTKYGSTVASDATRTSRDSESGTERSSDVVAENIDGTERLVKTGAETTATNSTETRNLTNTETGLVSKANTEGGTVDTSTTDTGTVSTKNTETGTVGKKGTDKGTVGTDTLETGTVGKTGTDTGTVGTDGLESGTIKKTGTDKGTVGTDVKETGTSSNVEEQGTYGVGGAGLVPQSKTSNSNTRDLNTDTDETRNLTSSDDETRNLSTDTTETRNLKSSDDETRNLKTGVDETRNLTSSEDETRDLTTTDTETRALRGTNAETRNLQGTEDENRNLTTKDSGTVGETGSSSLSFNGRTDATTTKQDRDATTTGSTTFGKVLDGTGKDTEKVAKTGTDSIDGGSTETYNNLRDSGGSSMDTTEKTTGTKKQTGTVGNAGTEMQTETFTSEGSTPLHTFQDLISQEVEGRSGQGWNFTDRVILDVQAIIALKIWNRRCNGSL